MAESKRVFQVGLQRRANPIYKQAAAMVEAGLIGQVTAIKAQWHRNNSWRRPIPVPKTDPDWASLERRLNWRLYRATSGGLMTELGSHQLDVANWLLGDHAEAGAGHRRHRLLARRPRGLRQHLLRLRIRNAPPSATDGTAAKAKPYTVRVTYSSLCNNAYEGASELILGTKGSLFLTTAKGCCSRNRTPKRWTGPRQGGHGRRGDGGQDAQAGERPVGAPRQADGNRHGGRGDDTRDELVSFLDHVRRRDPDTIADAQLGLRNAATVLIANQAAETGRRVEFPEGHGRAETRHGRISEANKRG